MDPYRNIADPQRFAPSTPLFTIFVGLTDFVDHFPKNSDEDENERTVCVCYVWCFCFEL